MDLNTQDIACYLPLNRSGDIFEITRHYKKTANFQTIILFLFIATSSFLYTKESCRIVLVSFLKLLLCAALSLIILPLVFSLLLIFAVFRQTVIITQIIKTGSKYGGILLGPDAIWAVEDPCAKSITNVLIVIKSNETGLEFYNRIEQHIKQLFFETLQPSNKILATLKRSSGYFFIEKNNVTPSECIKPLDKFGAGKIRKEDLMALLSGLSNSPLPKHHTSFWEVYIGTENVEWNTSDCHYFPIVFRVNHALGDGASLLKILTDILVEQKPVISEPHTVKTRKPWSYILNAYLKKVYVLLQAPFAVLVQGAIRKNDSNILHGSALSGEKILVFSTEKYSSCIPTIKKIKQRVPGVKFADVLFTAISSSLGEYYSKNSQIIPKSVTSVIPVLPGCAATNIDYELGTFQNSFSIALLDIPIIPKVNKFGAENHVNALKIMNKETTALKSAVDYQVNYWILNVVSKYLPESLLRPLIESSQSTLVISNLPGPKRISMFNEYSVEDIVFWIPHRGTTGVGISILSYDDRLQIGLNVDKVLIKSKEDAQSIVDNIFEEIHKMGIAINDNT